MKRAALACRMAVALRRAACAHSPAIFRNIERGKYLVQAGDCESCHTDKNGPPFAGARAIPTPFGTHLFAQHHARSRDRHRRLERRGFLSRHARRHQPRRLASVSRISVSVVHETDARRCARDQNVSRHARTRCASRFRRTSCTGRLSWRSLCRRVEHDVFQARRMAARIRTRARSGIAAVIWSKVPDIAARAIRRKTCSASVKKGDAFEGGEGENWLAPDLTGRTLGGVSEWSVDEIAQFLLTGANDRTRATRTDGGSRRTVHVASHRRRRESDSDLSEGSAERRQRRRQENRRHRDATRRAAAICISTTTAPPATWKTAWAKPAFSRR